MIGAIEAGGTKFVCAVADENLKVIDEVTIATTIPEETVGAAIAFFQKYPITSLGIGAFGPIEIRPDASNYGQILNTPKLAWRNFNLYTAFHEALNIPIKIDTDVNAAALAEYLHGHGRGKRSVLYITIGTGVGAGFVLHGETLYGLSHPEMGHILVRQDAKDVFEGNCPTHGNCLEGLVAGPAIEKRYGKKAMELSQEDPVWDYVADYIGQALMTF
ncbi:MAG: ROK family protein, partial [Vallitaleaceae bacterium]|nr:ROK family protein [Vallitaleaceae bacterium]